MRRSIILLALFLLTYAAYAQNNSPDQAGNPHPFVLGEVHTIQSKVLNEPRVLNIYLPEGYSQNAAATFPVIYLLDGSANEDFIHIVGLVQFLNMIEAMPPSIVAGIANVDRRRDFTFPTTVEQDKKDYPTTGSSEKFIAFIEKEVQPYIEGKYRTNSSKTIIGQSLGGLLATEILLKRPALFNNYLIVSPSLWWNNESLLKEAPALWGKQPDRDMNVYISVGAEGEQMEGDAKQLVDVLKKGKTKVNITFAPLPNENHLTILHNSAYKGFEVLNPKKG